MRKKGKKQKINNNIIRTDDNNNNDNESNEESGEENFLKEMDNSKDLSNNIHEIHNEVNCYILTDSMIIEGI